MLLILIFIGTVSATYGTLIVLAISFAIAAIGNSFYPYFSCKTRGHISRSCTRLFVRCPALLRPALDEGAKIQLLPVLSQVLGGAFMIMGMVAEGKE